MADIKAKDIAVAQSIASSDLILGSSIAGTTANVRVDTLGNYILKNIKQSDIGNVPTISFLSDLKTRFSIRQIWRETIITESPDVYYKCPTLIVLSKPSILFISYEWSADRPLAVGLSPNPEIKKSMSFYIYMSKDMISPKPYSDQYTPGALRAMGYAPAGTYYLYVASGNVSTGSPVTVTKIAELY
jgi:hypothetical protein